MKNETIIKKFMQRIRRGNATPAQRAIFKRFIDDIVADYNMDALIADVIIAKAIEGDNKNYSPNQR